MWPAEGRGGFGGPEQNAAAHHTLPPASQLTVIPCLAVRHLLLYQLRQEEYPNLSSFGQCRGSLFVMQVESAIATTHVSIASFQGRDLQHCRVLHMLHYTC